VTVTLASRLALHPHARFRRFDEEGVIVQQSTAEAIVVNDTAARLLELSDGTRTLGDCAGVIESEFDAGRDAIVRDVLLFAEELLAAGAATVL
jgi:hypothetical protein